MTATPVLHEDPIPFITLPNWVKAAAHCGFNIQPIFDELGIATDLLDVEHATIERPLLEKAMRRCVERAQRHHFPFVLGETFAFDYLPDIETFLTTSPTLREATRVFDWVRQLINPMLDIRVHEQDGIARLVLHFAGMDEERVPAPWFSETTFASILKFGRLLLGEDAPYTQLHFRHPPPPYAGRYESFFRVPVRFNQPEYALEMPRRLLDQPLPGGYERLHDQALQRVERRVRAMPKAHGIVGEVEQLLQRQPGLLSRGIADTARALDLHPRTLQRRLQQADTGFAELQARLRLQLAQRWLADPALDIDAISERLGYSDRRSFTRAFTRWAGMTPSAWRRQAGR